MPGFTRLQHETMAFALLVQYAEVAVLVAQINADEKRELFPIYVPTHDTRHRERPEFR